MYVNHETGTHENRLARQGDESGHWTATVVVLCRGADLSLEA
jgi:hypothetical protein